MPVTCAIYLNNPIKGLLTWQCVKTRKTNSNQRRDLNLRWLKRTLSDVSQASVCVFSRVSSSPLHTATRGRPRCILISLSALLPHSPLLRVCDFQDVARPADGVWRRECLSPSHRESLQGRWRAYNPTARVRGLQTYRQTSAVVSCCGAPSTGHTTEMWHYCPRQQSVCWYWNKWHLSGSISFCK